MHNYLPLCPIDIGFHASKSKDISKQSEILGVADFFCSLRWVAFSFLYLDMVEEITWNRILDIRLWFWHLPITIILGKVAYMKLLGYNLFTMLVWEQRKTKEIGRSKAIPAIITNIPFQQGWKYHLFLGNQKKNLLGRESTETKWRVWKWYNWWLYNLKC